MTKQKEPPYPPVTRRRSATAEDIAARRTGDYTPPASPHRVGHTPGLHGEDAPYLSGEIIRPGRPNGYSRTVPPTRQQKEEELDYPDDPPKRRTTVVVCAPVQPTRRRKEIIVLVECAARRLALWQATHVSNRRRCRSWR